LVPFALCFFILLGSKLPESSLLLLLFSDFIINKNKQRSIHTEMDRQHPTMAGEDSKMAAARKPVHEDDSMSADCDSLKRRRTTTMKKKTTRTEDVVTDAQQDEDESATDLTMLPFCDQSRHGGDGHDDDNNPEGHGHDTGDVQPPHPSPVLVHHEVRNIDFVFVLPAVCISSHTLTHLLDFVFFFVSDFSHSDRGPPVHFLPLPSACWTRQVARLPA
jgi:hypothetical protein